MRGFRLPGATIGQVEGYIGCFSAKALGDCMVYLLAVLAIEKKGIFRHIRARGTESLLYFDGSSNRNNNIKIRG